MRTSKLKAEAALKEAITDAGHEFVEPEEVMPVDKQSLRHKVGKDLPIDEGLVGCTKALLFENRFNTTVTITAPYCLKSNDHVAKGVTYRSMYLIYMSCDSEYEAAIKIVGNYSHWQKLKRCTWFIPYLEEWNAELGLREAALAKSKLVSLTERGNVTAARTLLNGKAAAPVGKPAKKGARKDDIIPGDLEEMLERTDLSGRKPN